MKKLLILLFTTIFLSSGIVFATQEKYNAAIAVAINKYKNKNYVGCIQDLESITQKDASSAFAHYYLAISYAQIGNKEKCLSEYSKVIDLATNSTLLQYAKTGKRCIETPELCIENKLSEPTKDQIESFINSNQKMTEKVQDTIKKLELNYERQRYNSNIAPETSNPTMPSVPDLSPVKPGMSNNSQPTNEEIANAVKVFQRLGISPFGTQNFNTNQTPEILEYQMLLGNNNGSNNNNVNMMLPYLMTQSNSKNSNMSPEFIKSFMMSSMMPDLSIFDTKQD